MKTYVFTIIALVLTFFRLQAQQVWTEVGSFPNYSLFSIHFPTSQTGYAVGGDYEDNTAVVLKTINGGQNWIVADSVVNHTPYEKVHFFDENNGFTVGFNTSTIYITSSGGSQWQTVDFPALDQIYDIVEVNGNLYLSGGREENNYHSQLYISTDMGISWTSIYQGDAPILGNISFLNNQVGYGVSVNSTLFKTTDGGTSWQQVSNNSFGTAVTDLAFKNNMIGFIGGTWYAPGLSRTTDGGNSWENLFMNPYSKFIVTYNNAVYAGGQYGSVIGSFDLGNTLIELIGSDVFGINGIYLFDEYTGVAVGNNGKIYMMDTSSLSIENPKPEKKIKVYPNPAENILNLEIAGQVSIQKICLTDMQGRLVKEYIGNFSKLDVRNIAAGNYFLQVFTEQGKTTKKIMVK